MLTATYTVWNESQTEQIIDPATTSGLTIEKKSFGTKIKLSGTKAQFDQFEQLMEAA